MPIKKHLAGLAPALLGSVVLLGCASNPTPPSDALAAAETAILRAEEAGAAASAPLELRTAREHLTAAQAAARGEEDEDMTQARLLAEKARADAEVAAARAEAARAQQANDEIQDGIDALRGEAMRPIGN